MSTVSVDLYDAFHLPPDATPSIWADQLHSRQRARIYADIEPLLRNGDEKGALDILYNEVPTFDKLEMLGGKGLDIKVVDGEFNVNDLPFVRLCKDAFEHHLPPDHPDHLPFLPLITGFSSAERAAIMNRFVDIIVKYFAGKVPYYFDKIRILYDELYPGERRFLLLDDATPTSEIPSDAEPLATSVTPASGRASTPKELSPPMAPSTVMQH
ncbi:hypothetical protein Q8F55_003673 [Vanrija albida]|uniref:Uncharacterized protein n=1 Tax=Vanrija albida TaxID=181172 RepID=A0ABR3Q4Y7_9TREE